MRATTIFFLISTNLPNGKLMADIVKHYLQKQGRAKINQHHTKFMLFSCTIMILKNLTLTFLLICSWQLSFTIRAFASCLPSHQIMKSTALATSMVKTWLVIYQVCKSIFANLYCLSITPDWRMRLFIVNKNNMANQNRNTLETDLTESHKSLISAAKRVLREEN